MYIFIALISTRSKFRHFVKSWFEIEDVSLLLRLYPNNWGTNVVFKIRHGNHIAMNQQQ